MSIKLDLYRIFSVTAQQHSFSRAAKELYMTQPAISQAISQLEEDLDTRLFSRSSKGVKLTNEGKKLYEYVSSALKLIQAGEKRLAEAKELDIGELRIGVGDTISKYYLLPYLEKFHNTYPNIRLNIINRTTPDLCALVNSGEADLAVCNLPIRDSSLEIIKLKQIQDIFVCGDRYRYLLDRELDLKDLIDLPLIFLESKANSRRYVDGFLAANGVRLKPEIELGSHDLLLEFARINLGVACVIREFSLDYLNSSQVYELKTKKTIPTRDVGCCFLKSVSLTPASERFIEVLMDN